MEKQHYFDGVMALLAKDFPENIQNIDYEDVTELIEGPIVMKPASEFCKGPCIHCDDTKVLNEGTVLESECYYCTSIISNF